MSQLSNSKGKDAGRKYTSLNLNQTYKGSKGENKPITAQNTRHGLQSLGKVSNRRAPVPANLPSLKSENSGNDPRINLVPTGTQGWVKKENQAQNGKTKDNQSTGVLPGQVKPKPGDIPEVSLRPNAGVVPSVKAPIPEMTEGQDSGKITWGSKVQPPQPPAGTSPYFQKEFPKLGVDGESSEDGKERDHMREGGQDASHQGMGHPAFMNGAKWMEKQGQMPLPPNFPPYAGGDRPMFNGNQQPYPYPYPPMYHTQGGRMPMPYPYPYPYPGPGGKMPPFDPRYFQRMPKSQFMSNSNSADRPSVVKDADLKSLDNEKDDAGWAGSQEEVDYNAKLTFDESDDSDDDGKGSRKTHKQGDSERRGENEHGNQKEKRDKHREQWDYRGFPPMQMPYGQNWHRFPGYDPQRGPPPPGPHGYPMHPMFYMPYGFHPNMQHPGSEKPEDADDEKKEDKDQHSTEEKKDVDRKAAKLKVIEERMKRRTEEEKRKEDESSKKHSQRRDRHDSFSNHSRNDGEGSSSTRREIPPRFRQYSVEHGGVPSESKRSDSESSGKMRIMQRKESLKSNEDGSREDVFEKENSKQNGGVTADSSNRYADRQQRFSSSSDTQEKGKSSRHGSSSSVHSRDSEKRDTQYDKPQLKKELKDLSETRNQDTKIEKDLKDRKKNLLEGKGGDFTDGRSKSGEALTINSQRFADNKLTKGQLRNNKVSNEQENKSTSQNKETLQPKKVSPWNKVVSGEKDLNKERSEQHKKSLREIQKEEEEEEIKNSKFEVKRSDDWKENREERFSPDVNKFRSDSTKYSKHQNEGRYTHDEKYEGKPDRPERRGRFDVANKRSGSRFERGDERYNRRDFDKYGGDDKRDRYSRDQRRDSKYERRDDKRDGTQSYNKREDHRRGDKKEGFSKDDRREGSAKDDKRDRHAKDDKRDRHAKDEKREGYAKDDRGVSNKKDDDYRRNERKEYHRKDEGFNDKKVERKEDRKDEYRDIKDDHKKEDHKKEGQRKDEKREDHKKEERREDSRKEEHWKDRRDDSRKFEKRDLHRKDYEKRDEQGIVGDRKRHDEKKNYHTEDRRRDDSRHDRKDNHPERDNNRTRRDYDEKRYESRRKHEWDNKDYRQSEEYKKEVKDHHERKEKQISKKDEASAMKENTENTTVGKVAKDEDKNKTTSSLDMEKSVDSKDEVQAQEKTSTTTEITPDVAPTENKQKNVGGFGVPDRSTRSRSGWNEGYDDSRGYRGSTRGRGRGRSYSTRDRDAASSTRSQRSSSSKYDRPNKSRDNYRHSKDRYYDDVSSGEFTDEEPEKTRPKSTSHDKHKHKIGWEDKPPRFQQKYENRDRGSRGRGFNPRGVSRGRGVERGRGRGRGRGNLSGHISGRNVGGASEKLHDEDRTGDDSEDFYSAEEYSSGEKDESKIDKPSSEQTSRERRPRSHPSFRPGSKVRGSSATAGRYKPSTFLAKRQQLGNNRTSNGHKTLAAADKYHADTGEVQTQLRVDVASKNPLNLEDISAHSPPKKIKSVPEKREEKKRDISREFDLNNIRGVVCIDDIKTDHDYHKAISEEDGFVTVTSKKQQKEIRDRHREEEKRKQFLEQKREAAVQKAARKDAQKAMSSTLNIKTKPVMFTDEITSSASADQVVVTTAPIATPVAPTAPASNAAMAAIGVWEPAQSLMKSAEGKVPTLTPVSNANAWKRPLTLNASSVHMPDPRAVGTGKPSSFHNGNKNKSTLIPTQPTPEAASPLVTPPALAPIGRTSTSELDAPVVNTEQADETQPDSKPKVDKQTSEQDKEKTKRREKGDAKRESGKINKRIIRERPPRFQTNQKKEVGNEMFDDSRKVGPSSRQSSYDSKSRKRSADRQRKIDSSNTKITSDVKQGKARPDKKSSRDEADNVFADEIKVTSEVNTNRKSKLSDADKVVGSNKPSLKSQSSVGSYTSSEQPVEETSVEVNIADSYQAPQKELFTEEEHKAKGTTRSVMKSLNDEERSLETRSLPGSPPPLAVKIPEPTLSGPSSDPGRGPSPSLSRSLPSIAQEMTDLNMKLFYARRAWDDLPSSSSVSVSVPSVTAVSSISSQQTIDDTPIPSSSTKRASAVTSSVDAVKKTEEKGSSAPHFTKRSEQQVCKVKPQQQLPAEDTHTFQVSSHQASHLTSQRDNGIPCTKYTSFVLPVERQMQQQSALYTTDTRYNEQLRSQANQALGFQSLNQVRSVDSNVSPMSQQLLSSFPTAGIYNTTLPASQNQMWQVVSTPNVQSKTIAAYQTAAPASLFTSPVSINNSQFIMQYGTHFPPQRSTSNLQRQQIGMVQVAQQHHHQTAQTARVVGMMPSNASSQMHHGQQYGLRSASEPHLSNANHMLMLDPTSVISQSQLSSQQRSDLVKHVHAKPFEPTSQTPPLMQSPPIVAQQSVQPIQPQQQNIPSVFSQNNTARPNYVQNMRYSQPLLQQQQQRQHNMQQIQQPTQLVASVRPRSVQGHTLPADNSSMALQHSSISAFEQAVLANSMVLKNRPVVNGMPLQLSQRPVNNQFSHHIITPQQQLRNVPRVQNTIQSRTSGPGPIQRPVQGHNQPLLMHPIGKQQLVPTSNTSDSDFKKIQRQKMLQDTKRYFQQDQNPEKTSIKKSVKEEKPVSSTTDVNLPKHKFILPGNPQDSRKTDYQKNPRSGTDQYKGHNRKNVSNGKTSVAKKEESSASSQQNKRPAASKVT